MTNKKMTLEEIAAEALDNARNDRVKTEKLLQKLDAVFNIDEEEPGSMQAAMLIGGHVVKLLEQMTRANEQLVRLAQIKERQESKLPPEEDKIKFTFKDLREAKIRIENEDEPEDDTNRRSDSEISKSVS